MAKVLVSMRTGIGVTRTMMTVLQGPPVIITSERRNRQFPEQTDQRNQPD